MPYTYTDQDQFNKATGLPRRPAIRNESGLPMGKLPKSLTISSHYNKNDHSSFGFFKPQQPSAIPPPVQPAPAGGVGTSAAGAPVGYMQFSDSGKGVPTTALGGLFGAQASGGFKQPTGWEDNLKREQGFNDAYAAQQKKESDFYRDRQARYDTVMAQQISPGEAIAMAQAQAAMNPNFRSTAFGSANKINAMADAIRMKSLRESLSGEAGNKAVAALHGIDNVDATSNMHNAQANLSTQNANWVGPQNQADIAQKYGHASYFQNMPKAKAFAATQKGGGAIGLKPSDIIKYQFQALKDFGTTPDSYNKAVGFLQQFKPIAGTSNTPALDYEQELG